MATHGSVSAFNPSKEDWTCYVERLNFYFVANDVSTEEKKRSILLAVCGASTYKLIRSLVEPDKLSTTSYKDLVDLVKRHYDPTPSSIVQRHKFNTRVCAPGETIANYVAALRALAEHCDYGGNLNAMLPDRLVCGVNHDTMQQRMMSKKALTFAEALEIAQTIEAAEKDSQQLKSAATTMSSSSTQEVHHTFTSRRRPVRTRKDQTPQGSTQISCHRCGGPHLTPACKFKEVVCYACRKRGHIARVCKFKSNNPKQGKPRRAHYVQEDSDNVDTEYTMFTCRELAAKPIYVEVCVNQIPIRMEVDTGASMSVVSQETYKMMQERGHTQQLQPSAIKLKTYTGEAIQILGQLPVEVKYGETNYNLIVQVVAGKGPNLMGRNWLRELKVTLGEVHLLDEPNSLQRILDKHSEYFEEKLGCLKSMKVKLQTHSDVQPKFHKAHPVPFALKPKVEEELDRLQKEEIISPVHFSNWAAPIVPVMKKNGSVRVCGDYRITANQACPVDPYPLPRVEDLLANLAGGRHFSKLDMSQAYLQLPLEDESKELVTVNTHKGLFQYNRLPFGIASAPAIFQRCMECLLQGLSGVSVYIDILIAGSSVDDHLQTLDKVLVRLKSSGLRLNKSKCFFLRDQIEYLGYVIDKDGLHPTAEKVLAIKEAPIPRNVAELGSFLGIINYYSRFLPNLSTRLAPLYKLLQKDVQWRWNAEHTKAFHAAKEALQTDSLLTHYNESKPLLLACDASQYGLGAILSHVLDNGEERPVAYVSRTLSPAEKNYSQLKKEGLAVILGVKKFHQYLYGRHFTIESDHRPLSYLFNQAKATSPTASSCILHWALTLSAYHYSIRYKAGSTLSNVDALSRLPRPVTTTSDCLPGDLIYLVNHLAGTAVNAGNVKEWTTKDPILSQVRRYTLVGWPDASLGEEFKPYQSHSNELSVLDGCVLWGSRIIVPPQCRAAVLNELHETHPGISRMKALARSYVWWPKMDTEIEAVVKNCTTCQESRPSPSSAPVHPWQ